MSATEKPLLDSKLLPSSLWDSETRIIHLPPILADAYQLLIDRYGLRLLAESRDSKNPPRGGLTKEKTDEHFAQAFDGSVARAQLAVIDPKEELSRASNAFIQALSGNDVCITDAPCGAGAAVFAFLTTVAELRTQNVLPRHPLNVQLIGAEISDHARTYATEILKEIRPALEQQAIYVEEEFLSWNVTDQMSNTDLIRKLTITTADIPKHLLIVANFNGFLEKEGKRKEAEPQLAELFRHASGKNSVAIWIEPQMNTAIADGGLFARIVKMASGIWQRFASVNTGGKSEDPILTSECKFQSPINTAKIHSVRLAVMRLDLDRTL